MNDSTVEVLRSAGTRPIILFGAGDIGERVYAVLRKLEICQPLCFCDNNKCGKTKKSALRIISPKDLSEEYPNAIIIISVASDAFRREIKTQLVSMGFSTSQIIDYIDFANAVVSENAELRWTDLEDFIDWEVNHNRMEHVAKWVDENDHSVIDFGAGDCYLKKCLRPGIKYVPTDCVARTPEFLVFDFNKDPFPDVSADVCFLLFMLSYVEDWKSFLTQACRAAAHKVIVGVSIELSNPEDQLLSFWATHFQTDSDIIATIEQSGFILREKYEDCLSDGAVAKKTLLFFERIN